MKIILIALNFLFGLLTTSLAQPFNIQASFSHGGSLRNYSIHLPLAFYAQPGRRFPLVLALHGGGGTAADFIRLTHLNDKADSADFIVVYPDGLRNPSGLRTWNAGNCCAMNAVIFKTDDVGFISRLIDTMVAGYRVDAKRVYATGHSNGAMLCYRLANELSGKIAAIAPNSGAFQLTGPYQPTRNVPVLHIHSKADSTVQYLGGWSKNMHIRSLYNQPVDKCLAIVASRAGCKPTKKSMASYPLYTIYEWTNCSTPAFKVQLYLTNDGGHSWPGGRKRLMPGHDLPSAAFDNDDVIWEFFKQFCLP